MSQVKRRQARRKKKNILRMLLFIGMISLVAVGGTATYFIYKLSNVTANTQVELNRGEKSELRAQPVDPSKDNISVLILGLDDRDGEFQ